MINYSIGTRIRQLRTENNLSQLQLALSAEITPAYLSLLERDEKNPTVNCLSKICNALNLSLKDFFDEGYDVENPVVNQINAELKKFNNTQQIELLEVIKHISNINNS